VIFELRQEFFFEAAHTLTREAEPESSRRIHGHTYHVEVAVRGQPDAATGMVMDLSDLRACIEAVRDQLDHRFLDDVGGLGAPTLENLCRFILLQMSKGLPGLESVTVSRRASGDSCTLRSTTGG